MIAGPDSHFQSLPYDEKRTYLREYFPTWFCVQTFTFSPVGFFSWGQYQSPATRNAWLRVLDPAEIVSVVGIWGAVQGLEQTHDEQAIHAFLERSLPFWPEGKFDAMGFDHWYQRGGQFMDHEIVFKHLSRTERNSVLHQWSLQLDKKLAKPQAISEVVKIDKRERPALK